MGEKSGSSGVSYLNHIVMIVKSPYKHVTVVYKVRSVQNTIKWSFSYNKILLYILHTW